MTHTTQKYFRVRMHGASHGFTLIEIVLGIAILTMFMIANSYYYKKALDVSQQTTRHIQSGFLLEEGIEALKLLLRDKGWTANIATLTDGATYYFVWDTVNKEWDATLTPQLVENTFTRSFVVSAVNRDNSGGGTQDFIVSSGGVLDPGTKRVVVTVSWPIKGGAVVSTESIETYITNIFSN